MSEVKWGILGCASISAKVVDAINEASNAKVVAVASRDKGKAEAWVAEHCPGAKAYGSYAEVLSDEEVQVVYIPIPTGLRAEWVIKAAAAKKHVLCEKPVATTRECRQMIDACNEAGVQFMDNTMFMHSDRLEAMRKVLDDTAVFGTPKHVSASFCIPFGLDQQWQKTNIRWKRTLEPLGCLGDLGWYCVRFALWVFKYEDPVSVSAHFVEETADGVPTHVFMTLKFSAGRTATLDCSFIHGLRQTAEVVSEKCVLTIDDFVINKEKSETAFKVTKINIGDKALTFPLEVIQDEVIKGTAQHTRLVECMSNLATGGKVDEFWPDRTMQTQMVLGALISSARKDSSWVRPREPSDARTPGGKGKGRGPLTAVGASSLTPAPPQSRTQPPKSRDYAAATAVASTGPVVKQKASFGTIGETTPISTGVNLKVKVISVGAATGTPPQLTAVLGDSSGIITFLPKGAAQEALCKVGNSLVLRNGSIKMMEGYMKLQVDRWGKIDVSDESFTFEPDLGNDMSATEYELVNEQ